MSTERLKLVVAYDGRPFSGWQSQAHGQGVQDHLERAFAAVLGGTVRVHGAGRTDSGVHALAQIAHADVEKGKVPLRQWARALNANLAPGIRVLRASRARPDFHARFDATGKIYTYRLWNAPSLHPLEIGRAWFVPGGLDSAILREGAKLFEGTHDFAGFAANRGHPVTDTVRTITRIRITQRGPLLTLRYEGDGFLYRMVRLLTGSLVRCAQRRVPLTWIEELLTNRAGRKTHYCAVAEGLYLTRVLY